jgi:Mor family transcriptional regulator
LQRIEQGTSLRELAQEYGVTWRTIRHAEQVGRRLFDLPDRPLVEQWKIPREQWPGIVSRVEQGASQMQLAREYGVAKTTIYRVLQAVQRDQTPVVRPPHYPGGIAPAQWPTILERIDHGESLSSVAQSYGVVESTIRRVEKAARMALSQPRSSLARQRCKLPVSEWPAMLARLERGEVPLEVAEAYGVSISTIRRAARLTHLSERQQKAKEGAPGS